MSLFEKVCNSYECRDDENSEEWHECTQKDICNKGIPKENYRPNKDDPTYFDNWVEQYDLICEPKWKIGLLGSTYFFGVICFVIVVPWLADKYGRKWNYVINCFVYVIATIVEIYASDIVVLFILLFI
jgi:hypothetical protein